jgi:hypothetical protein
LGRLIVATLLLMLSLFMLLGFLASEQDQSGPAIAVALLLMVGVPGVSSIYLFVTHFRRGKRAEERKEQLRRQTLDAEILKLAAERGGRLTIVELVTELALTPEAAKLSLDAMHARELAELEMTDSGLLVYSFRDVRGLGEKSRARGLLDV